MIELLGSLGWGLLACGAITHVWHHQRLRELLAMHLNHERIPAALLTAVEVVLAFAIPLAWLTPLPGLAVFALAALLVASGFILWIGRLLLRGSTLPCACSFSAAPTSWWSFGRACCVALAGVFAFVQPLADTPTALTTLAVGWGLAAAVFVLPEAIAWPPASRALLARVEAHAVETAAT